MILFNINYTNTVTKKELRDTIYKIKHKIDKHISLKNH